MAAASPRRSSDRTQRRARTPSTPDRRRPAATPGVARATAPRNVSTTRDPLRRLRPARRRSRPARARPSS